MVHTKLHFPSALLWSFIFSPRCVLFQVRFISTSWVILYPHVTVDQGTTKEKYVVTAFLSSNCSLNYHVWRIFIIFDTFWLSILCFNWMWNIIGDFRGDVTTIKTSAQYGLWLIKSGIVMKYVMSIYQWIATTGGSYRHKGCLLVLQSAAKTHTQ